MSHDQVDRQEEAPMAPDVPPEDGGAEGDDAEVPQEAQNADHGMETEGGVDEAASKEDGPQEAQNADHDMETEGGVAMAASETGSDEDANTTDLWAYERENDDGEELVGTNPLENRTLQELEDEDKNYDDPSSYEQEEEEIPEEWTDPTNSTDEWAYEKAHDDGTVLHGTNPLEAPGFVWEQDSLDDEQEHHDAGEDESQDEQQHHDEEEDESQPKNQVVLHAGDESVAHDSHEYNPYPPDEWESGEEIDDGTVLYGTNPLEEHDDEDEEEEEYDPNHSAVQVNSTNDDEDYGDDEDYDDGTVDYGTNPLDMPDDDEEEDDVEWHNSTHIDDEPGDYDDGVELYGTNPLESSDEEEEADDAAAKPNSNVKALPGPTENTDLQEHLPDHPDAIQPTKNETSEMVF